ncbi:MAG: hypothetical protein JJT89_03445 [Nitriliruptoraceae bacterium]|nr:hypothetical protein [Nitriliruptoraceae bacterium]
MAAEGPSPSDPAGIRTAVLVMSIVVTLVGVLLAVAYVPRTVASGGSEVGEWQVAVAPGIVSPAIRVTTPDGEVIRRSGLPATPHLAATQPLVVSTDPPVTVVVGEPPRGTGSVRITTAATGAVESGLRRVAWRQIHVRVVDAPVEVLDELVAIDRRGRVLETVEDVAVQPSR